MPDLFAISRDALQMQQHHERLRAPDRRVSPCRFQCSLAFSGARVASSVRLSQQRLLGRRLISDRRRTVTIACRSEARCHVLAEQRGERASHRLRSRRRRVVAAHRVDCDGLAVGNGDGSVIDEELIAASSKLEIVMVLVSPDP